MQNNALAGELNLVIIVSFFIKPRGAKEKATSASVDSPLVQL